MTPQDHIKLNKAKCLWINYLICEIQGYWAAYAAKNIQVEDIADLTLMLKIAKYDKDKGKQISFFFRNIHIETLFMKTFSIIHS